MQLDFKRPWSDGTSAIVLEAQALIFRLAAIVPPPRRHTTRYFGVLSSHSALRPLIVPAAAAAQQEPAAAPAEAADIDTAAAPAPKPVRKSKYMPWRELLRRTFGIGLGCHGELRLIALVKDEATIAKILGGKRRVLPPISAYALTRSRSESGPALSYVGSTAQCSSLKNTLRFAYRPRPHRCPQRPTRFRVPVKDSVGCGH